MWDDSPEQRNEPDDPPPGEAEVQPSPELAHTNGFDLVRASSDQELLPVPPQSMRDLELYDVTETNPAPPSKTRRIPNLGDTLLFFVMALVLVLIGQLIGVVILQATHLFSKRGFDSLFILSSTDARISIPIQAFAYGLIALVSVPVFTVIWDTPFGEGVRWNNATAGRLFVRLAILGLLVGGAVSLIGNVLPMPKNPPITRDIMKSPAGAWLMLAFGLMVAPLLEELAFRGFLLPGLINFFRWIGGLMSLSEKSMDRAGIPIAIVLTSFAFALMHSPQVSHAWGPLLLIGLVSIVLCVVRLAMRSVAAGVVVHAAYNLTLFLGVLYQTDGFRHLDKLT